MRMSIARKFRTVEEYLSSLSPQARDVAETMRRTVKKAAPQARELISYNMPAIELNGILVYYAAYKNHIGFYPTPSGIEAFREELSVYEGAKGSVKFPIDQPLPLRLIKSIVEFRVLENMEKVKSKTKE